jgi:GMP synthase (glutamine-hydrolysing)
MPKLLVCQHAAHEVLGTLDPLLRSSGFRIRYVNFARHPDAQPTLDGYHGLVLLGGPMNVDETERYPHLSVEKDLVRRALDRRMPVLGICLGAQLIARALGAEVTRSAVKEIGWYEAIPTPAGRTDRIVRHFGESARVFQWHGDTFAIPEGAVHLVSGNGCPNQAFRFGDNVYALQFHLEVDERMIARWLRVPEMRRELEESRPPFDAEKIRKETQEHIHSLRQLGERAFGEFLRLFGDRPRVRVLPSR